MQASLTKAPFASKEAASWMDRLTLRSTKRRSQGGLVCKQLGTYASQIARADVGTSCLYRVHRTSGQACMPAQAARHGHLQEFWSVVADAQLGAHGAHVAGGCPELVAGQIGVQVVLDLVLQAAVEPVHPDRAGHIVGRHHLHSKNT